MEKLMRESCLNNDGHEYEALRLTHIFWRIYDFIYKSNKADIFKHLYLSPKHLKDNMTELLKQKDIDAAQNLYSKINKNKDIFLEILDNILDLASFIRICTAEYACDDFESYNIKELISNINSILEEY